MTGRIKPVAAYLATEDEAIASAKRLAALFAEGASLRDKATAIAEAGSKAVKDEISGAAH